MARNPEAYRATAPVVTGGVNEPLQGPPDTGGAEGESPTAAHIAVRRLPRNARKAEGRARQAVPHRPARSVRHVGRATQSVTH